MKLSIIKTPSILRAITALLVIISLALVFRSSQRMSLTIDESTHFHCGLQWLQEGKYSAWPENPVLSRIIPALGAYSQGYRSGNFELEGENLGFWDHFLYAYRMDYFHAAGIDQPLFWIRLPIMLMFLLSMIPVWLWSRRLSGEWGALISTGFYAFTPVMMGHAGVSTTDVTFTAAFVLLMWVFFRWINHASLLNGLWLGIGLAGAMLTKFSVLPFFGLAMPVAFFLKWYLDDREMYQSTGKWVKGWLYSGLLAAGVMVMLIWAIHGFEVGPPGKVPVVHSLIENGLVSPIFDQIHVPAPEWVAGLLVLLEHNRQGMTSYMFGELNEMGFWYFYPVGLTLKTPFPALLMGLLGIAGFIRIPKKQLNWEVVALFLIPFALMLSVMTSHINIGVRHMMVVYPLFAIGATASAIRWLKTLPNGNKLSLYLPAGLLGFQVLIALIVYPNYLNYFNPLAGAEPGAIMSDSDVDWGQGLIELSEFAQENQIDTLHFAYFGAADECMYELPAIKPLPKNEPVKGWVAISENIYQGIFVFSSEYFHQKDTCRELVFDIHPENKPHTFYRWLDAYEVKANLTNSIRVYYVE